MKTRALILFGWIALALVMLAPCSFGITESDQLLQRLIRERQPGFTFDFAGVIAPADKASLDAILNELEGKTGAQVKVVTLTSLEGGEIRDFSNRLLQGWGIGQKGKDNGLLMLMAQEERKVWIEVGYGLEGIIPDAKAGRILDDYVMPSFRQGQFSRGLASGARAVASVIAAAQNITLSQGVEAPPSQPASADSKISVFDILIFLFIAYMLIRHPFLFLLFFSGGGRGGGGWSGGGFGGGGAGRSW
ncbi:MAG: TPM domain-containing protein [Lentisphaerota bacterium]